MLDWIPSWRWIPVALIFFAIGLIRGGATERLSGEEAILPNLALTVTRWCLIMLAVTFLFPAAHDGYLVQFSWLCRNLSVIGIREVLVGIGVVVALSLVSSALYDWSRPLLVAVSLSLDQLKGFAIEAALAALLANFLYVSFAAAFTMWHERPSWFASWLFWIQITVTVATAPWALRNLVYAVRISIEPGSLFLRSLWTFAVVAGDYVRPKGGLFASSYPMSVNFPTHGLPSSTSSTGTTRVLFLSDLHVARQGRPVMLSKVDFGNDSGPA